MVAATEHPFASVLSRPNGETESPDLDEPRARQRHHRRPLSRGRPPPAAHDRCRAGPGTVQSLFGRPSTNSSASTGSSRSRGNRPSPRKRRSWSGRTPRRGSDRRGGAPARGETGGAGVGVVHARITPGINEWEQVAVSTLPRSQSKTAALRHRSPTRLVPVPSESERAPKPPPRGLDSIPSLEPRSAPSQGSEPSQPRPPAVVYSDKREWDVPREVCEAIAAGDAEAPRTSRGCSMR